MEQFLKLVITKVQQIWKTAKADKECLFNVQVSLSQNKTVMISSKHICEALAAVTKAQQSSQDSISGKDRPTT